MSGELSQRGVHFPEVHSLSKCIVCRLCELHCPDFAIAVRGEDGPVGGEEVKCDDAQAG